MQVLIAQIINGLSLGSIYVLLVTGFNLLLLVAMIIHFAYPQVVVFSMYITWVVLQLTGNNILLGVLAGVGSSILLNLISAPLFQKVMKNRGEVDINSTMVLSLAMGMIITDVLSHSFNRGLPIAFPAQLSESTPVLRMGLITILSGQVWSLGVGVVAVTGFFLLLYKTRAGRAFRAIAEEFGFWIEELAIEEDHVHVFLEFPPKYSIARVIGILKSIAASRTFHQFPWLRRQFWSGELWEDGYCARTVGDQVTADLIRRYIRRHDDEQATNQPELF